MVKEFTQIERKDDTTSIEYLALKTPGSSRDMCLFCTQQEAEGSFVEIEASVDDSRAPVHRGYVRATTLFTGMKIEKESDTRTKLTFVRQIDMGGLIPSFILNKVLLKQPLVIAMLRDYIKDHPTD